MIPARGVRAERRRRLVGLPRLVLLLKVIDLRAETHQSPLQGGKLRQGVFVLRIGEVGHTLQLRLKSSDPAGDRSKLDFALCKLFGCGG